MKGWLPIIIGGLVLLLVAGGVGLYFLLKDDAGPTKVADATASRTEDPGTPGGQEPNFAESEDVASGFIQSIIDGDYQAAYGMLAANGQDMFPDGQALADDFFLTIGASTVTGAQTTSVTPGGGESDLDVRDQVTFELDTDSGTVGFSVQVCEEDGDLKICAYR